MTNCIVLVEQNVVDVDSVPLTNLHLRIYIFFFHEVSFSASLESKFHQKNFFIFQATKFGILIRMASMY